MVTCVMGFSFCLSISLTVLLSEQELKNISKVLKVNKAEDLYLFNEFS